MSRTGEVLALCVEDVQEDGRAIRVVVKTSITTKVAHVKAVEDGLGLEPVRILLERREEAFSLSQYEEAGRGDGFQRGNARPAAPLQALRYTPEGHMSQCEEGAATEAVLAGLPVPVVQAYGIWGNSAVSRSTWERHGAEFPLEDSRGRGGSHWGRHERQGMWCH